MVTMEAVTRLEWLGSHAAHGGRGGRSSARTMRAKREMQLALRNNYISAAPQILFIYIAAAPSAAGGLIIRFIHRRSQ